MKSLILIFIALGCGLVASIGISQIMDRGHSAGNDLEMEQILVALNDIDINSKLTAENVKLEDWPKNKIPEGAIRRLEDVTDKFASARFFRGEPIHVNRITDSVGNITIKIQEGYRVMPVKVEEDTVMKGISPGDRVDVLVFLRRNHDEIPVTGAFPILKNVRVFAVNTNTERATDAKGETTNFRTVSLLIKEEHTGDLVVASKMGNLFLTLRRPDETDSLGGEEATPLKDILAGHSKQGSEPAAPIVDSPPVPPPPATAAAPAAPEPIWSLSLLTPHGPQQFLWFNEKELPVQSPRNNPNSSQPAAAGATDNQNPPPPAPENGAGQPAGEANTP